MAANVSPRATTLTVAQFRGLAKVDWAFTFVAAAYNLVRVPKLIGAAT
jgi:hypothetical protein